MNSQPTIRRCPVQFEPFNAGVRSRSAFTLMETMLALMLAGLLLAGIYGAMDQSFKVSASGHEEVERAQLARALTRRFEIDIRAVTYTGPPPTEDTTASSTTTTTTGSSSSSSGGSSGSGGSSSGGSGGSSGGSSGGGSGGGGGGNSGGSRSGGGGGGGGGSSGGSGGSSVTQAMGSSSANIAAASAASSTSSSTDTSDTPYTGPNSRSIGVRGTAQLLEISISRPRRDLLPGLNANANPTASSDLRQVTYMFTTPGSGPTSGLVRMEGERMAVEVVEANGGISTSISAGQVVAPEVIAIAFRYLDGQTWLETWDSDTMGRIPRAIEINFAFAPPKTKAPLFRTPVSASTQSYRTVVQIPVSDPFPKVILQ